MEPVGDGTEDCKRQHSEMVDTYSNTEVNDAEVTSLIADKDTDRPNEKDFLQKDSENLKDTSSNGSPVTSSDLVLEREVASLKEISNKYYLESLRWKNAFESRSKELSSAKRAEKLLAVLKRRCEDIRTKNTAISPEELDNNILSIFSQYEHDPTHVRDVDIIDSLNSHILEKDREINILKQELDRTNSQHKHNKELIESLEFLVEEKGKLVKDIYTDVNDGSKSSFSVKASSLYSQQAFKTMRLKEELVQVCIESPEEKVLRQNIASLKAALNSESSRNKMLMTQLRHLTEDLSYSRDRFRQKCSQLVMQQKTYNMSKRRSEQEAQKTEELEKTIAELQKMIDNSHSSNLEKDAELEKLRQVVASLKESNDKLEKSVSHLEEELARHSKELEQKSRNTEDLMGDIRSLLQDLEASKLKIKELEFLELAQKNQRSYITSMESCVGRLEKDNRNLKDENKLLSEGSNSYPFPLADIINHTIQSSYRTFTSTTCLPKDARCLDSGNTEHSVSGGSYSNIIRGMSRPESNQSRDIHIHEDPAPSIDYRRSDSINKTYMKDLILNLIRIDKSHRVQLSQILGKTLDFKKEESLLLEKFFS